MIPSNFKYTPPHGSLSDFELGNQPYQFVDAPLTASTCFNWIVPPLQEGVVESPYTIAASKVVGWEALLFNASVQYQITLNPAWNFSPSKDLGVWVGISLTEVYLDHKSLYPWANYRILDEAKCSGFDQSITPKDSYSEYGYAFPDEKDNYLCALYYSATWFQPQGAVAVDGWLSKGWVIPATLESVHVYPWGFGHSQWRRDGRLEAIYPQDPVYIEEPLDPLEVKGVYIVINTIQVNELSQLTPLAAKNLTMSFDIDSFSWQCSFDVLNKASIDLIKPDLVNGLKDVEVIVNGYTWHFMVEKYTSNGSFGQAETWSVRATSRTRYLASPYAPKSSQRYTLATTARQIVDAQAAIAGFTVTWDSELPDWGIPADVYSFTDKTPIEVISDIVGGVGAVIIPSRDSDSIHIQPRYTTLPWDYGTVVSPTVIHPSMVSGIGETWQPNKLIDSLFVSGVDQGVLVRVVRSGSSDDKPGDSVAHPMILTEQLATKRGAQEIAMSGTKSDNELILRLFNNPVAPGLVLPGTIVEVQTEGNVDDYRGLVTAVQITASDSGGRPITQTIVVERSHE